MPLSSSVRERCRVFLEPGEELRYVFPAMSVALGRALGVVHFIVMITDSHVLLLSCSWFRRNKPDAVWGRYPRATRLGPVETSLAPTFTIADVTLETDEEYLPVIRAADAEISATDYFPPDPLPDL